jgi:excisionase family DNA binding protein
MASKDSTICGASALGRIVGLSRKVIVRLAAKGEIPRVRVAGTRVKFPRELAAEWINRNRHLVAASAPRPRVAGGADPRPGTVYVLRDCKGRVRYVGKTGKALNERWRQHRHSLRHGRANRHLLAVYGKYGPLTCQAIQECSAGQLDPRERHWIEFGRLAGWPLCNQRLGGDRGEMLEETKSRLSAISAAKWQQPEYRERHRLGMARMDRSKLSSDERARLAEKRQWDLAKHQQNMQLAAQRKAKAESRVAEFASLTWPTCRGRLIFGATRGLYFSVDPCAAPVVARHRWHVHDSAGGAVYPRTTIRGRKVSLVALAGVAAQRIGPRK